MNNKVPNNLQPNLISAYEIIKKVGMGLLGLFIGVALAAPPLTPAQIAADDAESKAEAAKDAAETAKEEAQTAKSTLESAKVAAVEAKVEQAQVEKARVEAKRTGIEAEKALRDAARAEAAAEAETARIAAIPSTPDAMCAQIEPDAIKLLQDTVDYKLTVLEVNRSSDNSSLRDNGTLFCQGSFITSKGTANFYFGTEITPQGQILITVKEIF
jgi:hypothetical protein